MEMRESKNQESADWLRKYQIRSQAMKNTVTLHAKLLDPRGSLNEVHNEKLQQHRWALILQTCSFLQYLNLCNLHHNNHTHPLMTQIVIFSYVKGSWPTKNEGVHERITGDEGTS